MQLFSRRHTALASVLVMAFLAFLVSPMVPVAAQTALPPAAARSNPVSAAGQPEGPQAVRGKQILYSDITGRLFVQCWQNNDFVVTPCWSSSDTGWANAVSGDFNGDGKAEIVATKGGIIQSFNPVPGTSPVAINDSLPAGLVYYQLVAGDFLGLGRDQVAVSYRAFNSTPQPPENFLIYYYVPGQGTVKVYGPSFGLVLQAASAGDVNGDGLADLVALPNAGDLVYIAFGNPNPAVMNNSLNWYIRPWPPGLSNPPSWNTTTVGDVSPAHAGQEIVLSSQASGTNFSLWVTSYRGLNQDLGYFYGSAHTPQFTSLALGDADGDGYKEVFALRNVQQSGSSAFLVMFNIAGAALPAFEPGGYDGINVWRKVAAGDLTGNGKAAVAIISSQGLRVYYQPIDPINPYAYRQLNGQLGETILSVADFGLPNVVMSVSPPSLIFEGVRGQALSWPLSINSNPANFAYNWTSQVLGGSPWLVVNPASGTAPGTPTAIIDTNSPSLTSGTYNDIIRISTTSQGLNPPLSVDIPVQVKFPTLAANPAAGLVYNIPANQYLASPANQGFWVFNGNTSAHVGWTTSLSGQSTSPITGRQWLTLSPPNGNTDAAMIVPVRPQDSGVGTLQANITINSNYGAQIVPVRITVADPGILAPTQPVVFAHAIGSATSESLAQAIQLQAPGAISSPTNWSVSSKPSWLNLDKSSGVASLAQPATVVLSINPTVADALGPGMHTETLVFQPNTGGYAAVNVSVLVAQTLEKAYVPILTK